MPGFQEAVKQNWEAPVQSNYAVEHLLPKLRRLSKGCNNGDRGKVGNIKLQLQLAKEILHHLEIERDSRQLPKTSSGC